MNFGIQSAEPADLPELRQLEQRARLLARMEGVNPDETHVEQHPVIAGVEVRHFAWHVFARKLVNAARLLTALRMTEEGARDAVRQEAA